MSRPYPSCRRPNKESVAFAEFSSSHSGARLGSLCVTGIERLRGLWAEGEFVLHICRRMPLRDAAEAHVLGEKGGIGETLLLAPDSQH
jgi:hypothetical protein